MISTLLLAAAPFVAFPAQGAKLPAIDHVYLAGAVAKGDTNVVVNGANVAVYRTGAWVTLIEATEGSNDVSVVSQSGEATSAALLAETTAPRLRAAAVRLSRMPSKPKPQNPTQP
jgi:uncharacterized protein YfaP (DUF2135 family)